ncbi:MAG: hypothetical protein Rubg2KO_25040 [Rubricoccaceae bacterium]
MRFALLALLLIASSCSSAQQTPAASPTPRATSSLSDLEATIDAIVREEMEMRHQPGVAVVIVKDGETILKRGYGLANVEAETPVDPDRTLFRIGSVSKALTALALTRLVDDGRVGLDDDVTQYIDGIQNVSGGDQPVTVWNLLTHTGGFDQIGGADRQIRQYDLPLEAQKELRPSLEAYLSGGKLRRITAPGQLFRYDTFGITLAGHVAAEAVGLDYAEMMRQELFDPIGMTRSFVEVDDAHRSDLAIGYGWIDGEYVAQPYEVYVTTPAASIDATPADMGRLLEALTGGGASTAGRLFSEAQAEAVLAPQFQPHSGFTGVTHGLWEFSEMDIPSEPQVRTVGHGGSMLGTSTSFSVLTEANVGYLVVTNRNHESGGGPDQVRGRIAQAILDHFYPDLPAKTVAPSVPVGDRDLSEYAHIFYDGVYCRTCTDEEFAQGAWRRRRPRPVTVVEEGLELEGTTFLPTAHPDVFVRSDGNHEMFFGRDATGRVSSFVFSISPYTFERPSAQEEAQIEGETVAVEAVQAGLAEAQRLDASSQPDAVASTLRAGLGAGALTEGAINTIGYQYLQADALAMALAVFQFNAETFASSWNVHDSYGEALAVAGRTEEAIAAYERSLELNPESESGRAALERLQSE